MDTYTTLEKGILKVIEDIFMYSKADIELIYKYTKKSMDKTILTCQFAHSMNINPQYLADTVRLIPRSENNYLQTLELLKECTIEYSISVVDIFESISKVEIGDLDQRTLFWYLGEMSALDIKGQKASKVLKILTMLKIENEN